MKRHIPVLFIIALLSMHGWCADLRNGDRITAGTPTAYSRGGWMMRMSETIRSLITKSGDAALLTLSLTAAAYGVLHALGPGHQKTLISGCILSEGGGFGKVVRAAFIAAATHAFSVTALFGSLALLSGSLSAAQGEPARLLVTRISAALLILLSGWNLFKRVRNVRSRHHGGSGHECGCAEHHHNAHECGCTAHDHNKSGSTGMLILGSLVPCPGAAFFLLLGFSAGYPLAGVAAVVSISLGMWATLTVVGAFALAVRKTGERRAGSGRGAEVIKSCFEIGGGLLVFAFSVGLFFL